MNANPPCLCPHGQPTAGPLFLHGDFQICPQTGGQRRARTTLSCDLPWVHACWIVSQSCEGSLSEQQNPMRMRVLRGTDALCRRNGTWSGPPGPSIGVCFLCVRGEVSLRLSSRNGLRHTVCRVPLQRLQAHLQLRRQVRAEWDRG